MKTYKSILLILVSSPSIFNVLRSEIIHISGSNTTFTDNYFLFPFFTMCI
ncbi:hypothetical protein [Winogradskyella undariae]|nr:hypothetical protein [Winogradskyella undariae]